MGCALYGVSVRACGLGPLVSATIWLCCVWRHREYLWHDLPRIRYHMAELCVTSEQVLSAWVYPHRFSSGCTLCDVKINTFGLGLIAAVITWLYSSA